MKKINLEISDKQYSKLIKLLESFPKGSYHLEEKDSDLFLAEENEKIYRVKKSSAIIKKIETAFLESANESEIKLKLVGLISSFDSNQLNEFYKKLCDSIPIVVGEELWNQLIKSEQEGIESAISEIESGKVISHEEIIKKYRKKYSNA